MTTLHYWSIAAALISAATPWFVVRLALAVARNHARAVEAPFPEPRSLSRLGALTIVACAAATAAAFLLPPPSIVVAAIDLVCFAGLATLGLLALGDIHEVWMREEVSGGAVGDVPSLAASRVRKVRLIFAAEVTLVVCLNLAGHALLDLDWSAPPPWAGFVLAASAAIGITGCALAVSSELARRRYAPHDAR